MKNLVLFLGKVLGVALILLFAFWVVSLVWGSYWVSPECPECTATNTPVVSTGDIVLGEEKVCKYAEDFDSEGKVVPTGTVVEGPAFIKPDRNLDWGYPVYVGETYKTEASDEVVWILIGDDACIDSQSEFFSFWGKTEPTN